MHDTPKSPPVARAELTNVDRNPYQALQLIDRLGLYRTIFTTFDDQLDQSVKTLHWEKAYEQLLEIMNAKPPVETKQETQGHSLAIIKSILLSGSDNAQQEVFHAWLLCAFVPWARVTASTTSKSKGKMPPKPAAVAAQQGIKAENKTIKVVENAVTYLDEIIRMKDALADPTSTTSPPKRKRDSQIRSELGMAIRQWGPHWRNSVMYALLTQIMEHSVDGEYLSSCLTGCCYNTLGQGTNCQGILDGYARWLSTIQDLDLLKAYQLKPLVTGDKLAKALDARTGPWVAKALEIVVAWQLANPDEEDPEAAILEVKGKKKELSLG